MRRIFFVIACIFPLELSSKDLLNENFRITGSVSKIELSRSDPVSELYTKFDVFCLERPGFKVKMPFDGVKFFINSEGLEVQLHNLGMLECPNGWDLHKMGHKYFTGHGSNWYVAVYKLNSVWRSVWFTASAAEVSFEIDQMPYVMAEVHPSYCEGNTDDCMIKIMLP